MLPRLVAAALVTLAASRAPGSRRPSSAAASSLWPGRSSWRWPTAQRCSERGCRSRARAPASFTPRSQMPSSACATVRGRTRDDQLGHRLGRGRRGSHRHPRGRRVAGRIPRLRRVRRPEHPAHRTHAPGPRRDTRSRGEQARHARVSPNSAADAHGRAAHRTPKCGTLDLSPSTRFTNRASVPDRRPLLQRRAAPVDVQVRSADVRARDLHQHIVRLLNRRARNLRDRYVAWVRCKRALSSCSSSSGETHTPD